MCSLQPSTAALTTQTLEQRAGPHSRKARTKARIAKGKPKATSAERGRTSVPRVKKKGRQEKGKSEIGEEADTCSEGGRGIAEADITTVRD